MKWKLSSVIVVVLFAVVVSFNIYVLKNNIILSDLALNNIEAFADNNEWGSEWCYYNPLTTECNPYGYGIACYCGM